MLRLLQGGECLLRHVVRALTFIQGAEGAELVPIRDDQASLLSSRSYVVYGTPRLARLNVSTLTEHLFDSCLETPAAFTIRKESGC